VKYFSEKNIKKYKEKIENILIDILLLPIIILIWAFEKVIENLNT
jgi:hypothetical protein